MSKTIFVTGAAGFIGSHATEALLARGDTVVGLDNLNDYYDPSRKRDNLASIQDAGHGTSFHFVRGDIRNRELVRNLLAKHDFDAVVHLAALPGVRASAADPHLYFDVNLGGTLNLLDAVTVSPKTSFVFASTSSVYGATKQIPFVEHDPCDRPLAPYPASKRAAEMLGFTYHNLFGLNFTALRFFTVYGPRNRPDMMAHMLADNLVRGRKVSLYQNGRMWRDWTYVADIVAGIVAAVDRPLGYEVVNLGRGQPVLLADFVEVIERLAGRKTNLLPAPMPDTDVPSTHADITRATNLLGYEPHVSVAEGAARFWEWYQRNVCESPQVPPSPAAEEMLETARR